MAFPALRSGIAFAAIVILAVFWRLGTSGAEPLSLAPSNLYPASVFAPVLRDRDSDDAAHEIRSGASQLPARLRRQMVEYPSREAPGTIIIDTANTSLYFILGGGKALRYGIGVGREGFTWSGVEFISRMAEWPDWIPPTEMIARQPYLPRFVAGGPGNPLGARALYLGNTAYRIHGTNDPSTIGRRVSSGCIRMTNEDVIDLYNRVRIGTKVIVLSTTSHRPSVRAGAGSATAPLAATERSRILRLH